MSRIGEYIRDWVRRWLLPDLELRRRLAAEQAIERLDPLLIQCDHCGALNASTMRFCGQCGTRLLVDCPRCGAANPPQHAFCGQCGGSLTGAMPAQAQPQDSADALIQALEGDVVQPAAERDEIPLQGERRLVTVLIADVKGSTDLLERIGNEEWVRMMNHVLHLLEAEVYRYGGRVDQFRGDGLVAFFGVALTHEDDPERAVLAALSMQEAIKTYASELSQSQGIELLLRVGLNSGEVIVANIGDSRQHSEDTAMGRAISIASRLEAAAEPGTVLVSESTYHMVATQFKWQPLGEMTFKGISEPIAVYCPLAPVSEAELAHRLHAYGLSSPLIGRKHEFRAFEKCVQDLLDEKGGIVLLSGERGMGKSLLVAKVRTHFMGNGGEPAVAEKELVWLQVRCRSYEQSRPYSLWSNLLRRWLDMQEGEPAEQACARLGRQAQSLWEERSAEHYPYLAMLLSLPVEDTFREQIRQLSAEGVRRQFFFTLQSWVEEMAKRHPLVLTFGDMHWIDATSLDVLKYTLALCELESLLWVLVFRPERNSSIWQFRYDVETEYPHRLTSVMLSPLTTKQSAAMIDQLVGSDVLPTKTRDLIIERAEGNPYYIREFIHSLIRQEALVQDAQTGEWHATRSVAALDLPSTLQNLLLSRIDGLSADVRRTLQIASVMGSVFWSSVLQAIIGDVEAMRGHLTALQRAQLIYEGSRVPILGKEYVFGSTLICDAVYEGLLAEQRLSYHRQVAEYFEQLLGAEDLTPYYSVVAYHYRHAQAWKKELYYTQSAAKQAQNVYANAEALQHYTRVLELLAKLHETEADLDAFHGKLGSFWDCKLASLTGLGQVLFGMGRVVDAEADFRVAIALATEIAAPAKTIVRLYYWLAESLHWQDRYDEQVKIGQEGLALLGSDTESLEAALMNQEIASGYNLKGKHAKFREFTFRTIQFIEQLPYAEELRPAYDHIAILYAYYDKNVAEATRWLRALEKQAEQHHDLRAFGEVYLLGGEFSARTGDLRQAVIEMKKALEFFERVNDAKHASWCLANLGRTFLSLGNLEQARTYAQESLRLAQATGIKRFVKSAYWSIARIFICQADYKKAIEALQQVSEFSRETGDMQGSMWSTYALGQVYLAQGNRRLALDRFRQAASLAGPEISEQQLLDFVAVLSGLENAYDQVEAFRVFYRRVQEKEAWNLASLQGFLEPAQIEIQSDQAAAVYDRFVETLSADWVWLDPFGDCSVTVYKGLEIDAANGRDLWHVNRSAPRVLRPAAGDWVVQVVCEAVSAKQPAIGGVLLWLDDENYWCLDWGKRGGREISFAGCEQNQDRVFGRGRLPGDIVQRVFLRLEKRRDRLSAFCSPDGDRWFAVGQASFPTKDAVQVGLHAIGAIDRGIYRGAYPDGTAIRFQSFGLWLL